MFICQFQVVNSRDNHSAGPDSMRSLQYSDIRIRSRMSGCRPYRSLCLLALLYGHPALESIVSGDVR